MVPSLLLLLAASSAEAITADVCSSGCDFSDLQSALSDVSVDTILLADESYEGPFSVSHRVVRLVGGSSSRLHCGSATGEVSTIAVNTGTLVLDGLTVEPCTEGRAVLVDDGGRLFLENTLIDGLSAPTSVDGRGVYMAANTQGHVLGSAFQNLHAGSASGGAIFLSSGVEWFDQSSVYDNNKAALGAAIYASFATVLVDGGDFSSNHAVTAGGSVWAFNGSVDVWDSVFQDGQPSKGSYLYTDGSAVHLWPGTVFNGGGTQVELIRGQHQIHGTDFLGGVTKIDWTSQTGSDQLDIRASSFIGGGLGVKTTGANSERALYLGHSEFRDLVGSTKAGAMELYEQSAELEGNVFENTRSKCCNTQNAGGVAFQGTTYTYSVHHNRFCFNSGNNSSGGAMLWNKGGGAVEYNLFLGHYIASDHIVDGKPEWHNNTVLESRWLVSVGTRGSNSFTDNLVLYSQPSIMFPDGALSPRSYNMYGPNITGVTTEGTFGSLETSIADPMLVTPRASYACDSDLRPAPGSPLVDSGTPGEKDPDGSPLDIGAFAAQDGDRDGSPFGTDCNDQARNQRPGLPELCDGVDNDCDGDVDEGSSEGRTWYIDDDGDGFGTPSGAITSCTFVAGRVLNNEDCADSDSGRNPLVNEVCADGIDNNCDGLTDDGTAADATAHYADNDDDGFGDDDTQQRSCIVPSFRVEQGGDCDDGDTLVSPDADEVCDGIDNNCNGTVDGDLAIDPMSWWLDGDVDGFGDPDDEHVSCEAPEGYVDNGDDCNDADAAVSPAGIEVCSGRSEDCDDEIDEDPADAPAFWPDSDEDGAGNPDGVERFCSQPDGYVTNSLDCDDTNADVNLGALEVCNGLDDDCDGITDPSTADGVQLWFVDGDRDGFGAPDTGEISCGTGGGLTLDDTDCDDASDRVHPGAEEVCNEVDDDCVNGVDGADSLDARDWFPDADEDSFGADADPIRACEAPPFTADRSGDCNDAASAVNPDALEVCNEVDDDCDLTIDGPLADGAVDWYLDSDEDGFGQDADLERACEAPEGRVALPGDCDDALVDVNPDAAEVCNDRDDNCSGQADDGLEFGLFFRDNDEDGYGAGDGEARCIGGLGWAEASSDCDDGDPSVSPGADEIWYDGVDQDCDGNDEDRDGDGFLAPEVGGEDCDDTDPLTFPGAEPDADGTPRDCIRVIQVVSLGGGCGGCSGGNGSPSAVWALMLLGLLRRQTRSPV